MIEFSLTDLLRKIHGGRGYVSFMIACVTTLHLWWAVSILMDGNAAIGGTALDAVHKILGHRYIIGIVLIGVSVAAIIGLVKQRCIWMVPQQVMLMVSAAGAITAIAMGAYPDGTIRPSIFIADDQAAIICITFWHLISVAAYSAHEHYSGK